MRNAICAIALLFAAGCGTKTCKDGTLFMSVTLNGATASADTLGVRIEIGTQTLTASGPHRAGVSQGTIEVDFPHGYPSGQSVRVTIAALHGGSELGEGSATAKLSSSCAALPIVVGDTADLSETNDLEARDLALVDMIGVDFATNADLSDAAVPAQTDFAHVPDLANAPPQFAGATSATQKSATTIDVSWNAASDDTTPTNQIVYDVYQATTDHGQNFGQAPAATSAAGATTITMNGLAPQTTYYFVVRARDSKGLSDGNLVQVSAMTAADTTPPIFAGVGSVNVINGSQLQPTWTAATDNVTPSSQIRYAVCWNTTASNCQGASFVAMATTAQGATSFTITGLSANTQYGVVVRALDQFNNQDGNNVAKLGTTTP